VSRVCQVTGRRPLSGNNVSRSHHSTKRRFSPNLQSKRYWLAGEGRWIRLRVSARGIKVIDRRGIDRFVADIRARGEEV
jgi:large subunit ribosomal protein L28